MGPSISSDFLDEKRSFDFVVCFFRNQWLQNKRNLAPQRTFPVNHTLSLYATLSRAFSQLCKISSSFPYFFSIGYRLRWRSDIWSTNRGAAEVGTPDIRPTTEDDIRHNATTQDKDLLRIIMPFRFSFLFSFIGC